VEPLRQDSTPLGESYCLFDAESIREQGGSLEGVSPAYWDHDEELYLHDNMVVWSAGHQVRKRFSSATAIIQAKWCRLDGIKEPLLCLLHSDSLTTCTPSGKVWWGFRV
jgi:anaphase-promoting complex subunit 1